jgi:hypothetical protein
VGDGTSKSSGTTAEVRVRLPNYFERRLKLAALNRCGRLRAARRVRVDGGLQIITTMCNVYNPMYELMTFFYQ